ncbi:MAG: nuclear transport factor 2 family protein [Gammaproteobacteria bacterium]|nr:nuclear transport factor 2 family protein [Gammaproteobacteria bacterium]
MRIFKNFIFFCRPVLLLLTLSWAAAAIAEGRDTERTRTLTKQYIERLSNADDAISEFWANDIVLFVHNHGPWGGDYRGKKSVSQYYREMCNMFELEKGVKFELLQTVVDGNHSSIRFRVQAQHILGPYDNHYMQVYTWNEDGKLSRIENFYGWEPFLEFQRQATGQPKSP